MARLGKGNKMGNSNRLLVIMKRILLMAVGFIWMVAIATAQDQDETEERIRIAAANMEDAVIVDCQLPGKLRRLGGTRTYLTPGRLIRTSAIVCRTRGGEYTLGDLASGTLSLQRWMGPAEEGDMEAQYYVARIYANGMDNVPVSYSEAAKWYQLAADQGYAEAKQELGYLYEQGLGVERDEILALNLQREASGLGEQLDYAYKIADAQALVDGLAGRLAQANATLQDTQQLLRESQNRLAAVQAESRVSESRMASLIAELEAAKAAAGSGDAAKVDALEREISGLQADLHDNQARILTLQRERDAANQNLAAQLASSQATRREMREIISRTESSESAVDSLTAELADTQQRLIESDEEVRRLQLAYQEQSQQLQIERERYLVARNQSDSDAAAYIAVTQAELASKSARVDSLEAQIQDLRSDLGEAQDSEVEDMLRRQLDTLQARYEEDVAALRQQEEHLRATNAASQQELEALYAESAQQMSAKDAQLNAQKRQIESLRAESGQLRAQLDDMQARHLAQVQEADSTASALGTEVQTVRNLLSRLTGDLDELRTEKTAMEARLLRDKLRVQAELKSAVASKTEEIDLLRAEIAAAESTIDSQVLRIASLERRIGELNVELASVSEEIGTPPPMSEEARLAMEVLEMARSPEDPNLGQYHALIIANEKYEKLEPLTTPVRDAYEIEQLLAGRYGFNVEVIANVTEDDVMTKLHEYSNTMTPDDNLLIYYTGRGSTPDGPPDKAYWLGVDADPVIKSGWILAEHVSETIRQIEAKRVLVITDSCFSKRRVQANTTSVGRGLDPERFKLLSRFQSRYVLTSGRNVPYSGDSGDRTHSMFAKYFMEILRHNSNVLSGEMLSFELSQRVRENVEGPEGAMPSYSSLQGAGHQAGDFFFVPAEQSIMVAGL